MSNKEPNMAQVASQILQDSLQNIIHDILITKHRDHKLLLNSLDPKTKLPNCDRCGLPRLLKPPLAPKVRGATCEPPKDTQYCDRKPWSRRPGHDIYDNPFPKMDMSGRPPKPSKNNKKDADGGSNEEVNGTAPPSPSADGEGGGGAGANTGGTGKDKQLEKGEKKASKIDEKLKKGEYVPWHTCPTCKRSLLITRFAKHLEQCMGLSGRAASRNALAKMNGANSNSNTTGAGSGTPVGSRGGTPNPGGANAASQDLKSDDRDGDDSDDGSPAGKGKGSGGVRKKMLKKGMKEKLLKKEKGATGAANGKLPKSLPSKRPPAGGEGKDSSKRDRDDFDDVDEEDTVHVKKRQKLQRVGSTASMASMSSAPPASAVDPDPGESVDGSFVDDASVADD